jgi:hypothetical protein
MIKLGSILNNIYLVLNHIDALHNGPQLKPFTMNLNSNPSQWTPTRALHNGPQLKPFTMNPNSSPSQWAPNSSPSQWTPTQALHNGPQLKPFTTDLNSSPSQWTIFLIILNFHYHSVSPRAYTKIIWIYHRINVHTSMSERGKWIYLL